MLLLPPWPTYAVLPVYYTHLQNGMRFFSRFKRTNSKKEQICFHVKRDTILKLSFKYSSSYFCHVQSTVFKRFNDDPVSFTLISLFEVSQFASF